MNYPLLSNNNSIPPRRQLYLAVLSKVKTTLQLLSHTLLFHFLVFCFFLFHVFMFHFYNDCLILYFIQDLIQSCMIHSISWLCERLRILSTCAHLSNFTDSGFVLPLISQHEFTPVPNKVYSGSCSPDLTHG